MNGMGAEAWLAGTRMEQFAALACLADILVLMRIVIKKDSSSRVGFKRPGLLGARFNLKSPIRPEAYRIRLEGRDGPDSGASPRRLGPVSFISFRPDRAVPTAGLATIRSSRLSWQQGSLGNRSVLAKMAASPHGAAIIHSGYSQRGNSSQRWGTASPDPV